MPTKVGGSGVGQLRESIGRRIAEGRGGYGREVVGAAGSRRQLGVGIIERPKKVRKWRLAVGFEGSDLAST